MRHIKIGWGRDYGDIAPMVGVIKGPDQHSLQVSVDVASRFGLQTQELNISLTSIGLLVSIFHIA